MRKGFRKMLSLYIVNSVGGPRTALTLAIVSHFLATLLREVDETSYAGFTRGFMESRFKGYTHHPGVKPMNLTQERLHGEG